MLEKKYKTLLNYTGHWLQSGVGIGGLTRLLKTRIMSKVNETDIERGNINSVCT